jgi:hypothetical protein
MHESRITQLTPSPTKGVVTWAASPIKVTPGARLPVQPVCGEVVHDPRPERPVAVRDDVLHRLGVRPEVVVLEEEPLERVPVGDVNRTKYAKVLWSRDSNVLPGVGHRPGGS